MMKQLWGKIASVVALSLVVATVLPSDAYFLSQNKIDSVEAAGLTTTENGFTVTNGVLTAYDSSRTATSITIPTGVTKINDNVFNNNTRIVSVTIPSTVKYIGDDAFYKCTNLTTVKFGKGIRSIGEYAFKECTNLQKADLSNTKITLVTSNAFQGCTTLSTVTLPDSVEEVGYYAFGGCSNLSSVNLPEGVRVIANRAFENCDGLNTVNLPDSLETIGEGAFYDCDGLTSVKIPGKITSLSARTFYHCYSLKNVYLPDGLKTIGEGALNTWCAKGQSTGHGALNSVYIPSSVTSISKDSFDFAGYSGGAMGVRINTGVTIVYGEAGSTAASFVAANASGVTNGVTFSGVSKNANITFNANGGSVSMDSKEGIVGQSFGYLPTPKLKGYRFTGWYSDTSLKTRIKTTNIIKNSSYTLYAGWETSSGTTTSYEGESSDFTISGGKLTSYTGRESVVVIPDGVTEIGINAFYDKDFIKTIVIPESVSVIGSGAFQNCRSLTELTIPSKVTSVPANMCNSCLSMRKVKIKGTVTSIGQSAFLETNALQEINLPEGLTLIGDSAFSGSGLQTIQLPDSLSSLGINCFRDCAALNSIGIPVGVSQIPNGCFDKDKSLKNVYLNDGQTALGRNAFNDCFGLSTIYFPESLYNINEKAFSDAKTDDGRDLNITYSIANGQGYESFNAVKTGVYQPANKGWNVTGTLTPYDTTLHFVTGVNGQTFSDKTTCVAGQSFGSLPTPQKNGDAFVGWSLTENGTSLIKTSSVIPNSGTINLYAVYASGYSADAGDDVGPNGTPIYTKQTTDENGVVYNEITTAEQLAAISNDLSANYKLMADINLSGYNGGDSYGWRPIGVSSTHPEGLAFTGIFDGNGHTISNLTIKGATESTFSPYYAVGLFGRVTGGTIKNLTLSNVNISATDAGGGVGVDADGYAWVGALAGLVYEDSSLDTSVPAKISNVKVVSGTVEYLADTSSPSENIAIGGLVGYFGNGTMTTCANAANVKYYSTVQENRLTTATSRFLGGITGYLTDGTISYCRNTGNVFTYRDYYGLWAANTSDIVQSSVTGLDCYVICAGICGVAQQNGTIKESYNTGNITAYSRNEKTLFSTNFSSHSDSMSGGITGALYRSTKVENCYNTGTIRSWSESTTTLLDLQGKTRADYEGTIMAYLDENTVSALDASRSYAGGIVGYSSNQTGGPVDRCANFGKVIGADGYTAGIAVGTVPCYYSYYLETTATKGTTGTDNAVQKCNAIGADAMTTAATYNGFDFNGVWVLAGTMDHPYLSRNTDASLPTASWVVDKPTKISYGYGEDLDVSGMQVKLTANNGSNYTVNLSGDMGATFNPFQSGEQTITVTYMNLTSTFTVTVTKPDISSKSFALSQTSFDYDGSEKKPTVSATGVKEGTDYTVSYANNVNAGTAKAVITGMGNYGGKTELEFTINPISIRNMTLSLDESTYTYTGSEICPTVSISGLQNGRDFTVSYKNNVNPGYASLTVTGKGNYTGTKSTSFYIERPKSDTPVNPGSGDSGSGNSGSGNSGSGSSGNSDSSTPSGNTGSSDGGNANSGVTEPNNDNGGSSSGNASEGQLPSNITNNGDGTLTVSDNDLGNTVINTAVVEEGMVYRMYNPNSGEHFYTKDASERDSLVAGGWNYEENASFATISATEPGAVPVYRVYNPNDGLHHYTMSKDEALMLKGIGWNYEGISLYVYDKDSSYGAEQYRLYNPNDGQHHWTVDAAERDMLASIGWNYEGVAWRVK